MKGRSPEHEFGDRPTPRLLDPMWRWAASRTAEDAAQPTVMEEAEEPEERAAGEREAPDDFWRHVTATSMRESRLRFALERLRFLDDQGIDWRRPSSNIGRVLRIEELRGPGWVWTGRLDIRAALDLLAQDAADYARPLGDGVNVRISIPNLVWTGTLGHAYDGDLVAPHVEVEIVEPGPGPPERRVEILTFERVDGHDLKDVVSLVSFVAHEFFGEDVRLRIKGLLPNAPEGATREEILHDAVRKNCDLLPDAPEGAEAWEMLDEAFRKNRGGLEPWRALEVRCMTVEVVK